MRILLIIQLTTAAVAPRGRCRVPCGRSNVLTPDGADGGREHPAWVCPGPAPPRRLNVAFADLEDETIDNPEIGTYAGQLVLALVRDGGLALDALGELSPEVRSSSWADKMALALFGGLFSSKVRLACGPNGASRQRWKLTRLRTPPAVAW